MSDYYSAFMEKPYKKFACGEDSQKIQDTLSKAFTATSKESEFKEQARFEMLVEDVMKSKKGHETLKELTELGYSFAFETGNFGGFCSPDEKKIALNPKMSDEYLMGVIVHEGRHAIQDSLKRADFPEYAEMQTASALSYRRAIEADACAHQSAFVYEVKDILPHVYQEELKKEKPMFKAYASEMDKSGDEKKAMQASFKAWYDCESYRDYYDDNHKKNIVQNAFRGRKDSVHGLFSKEVKPIEIVNVCVHNGQSYMTEADLKTGLPFAIKDSDKKEIFEAVSKYAEQFLFVKTDKSVLSMLSREEVMAKKDMEKTQQQSVVVSALKSKKER